MTPNVRDYMVHIWNTFWLRLNRYTVFTKPFIIPGSYRDQQVYYHSSLPVSSSGVPAVVNNRHDDRVESKRTSSESAEKPLSVSRTDQSSWLISTSSSVTGFLRHTIKLHHWEYFTTRLRLAIGPDDQTTRRPDPSVGCNYRSQTILTKIAPFLYKQKLLFKV